MLIDMMSFRCYLNKNVKTKLFSKNLTQSIFDIFFYQSYKKLEAINELLLKETVTQDLVFTEDIDLNLGSCVY